MVPAQGIHRIDSHSVNTTESQIRSSSLIRQDAIINSTRLETDAVKKRVNGFIKKKKKESEWGSTPHREVQKLNSYHRI